MYIIANECPGFYLPPVMLVLTNDMVRKVRMVFRTNVDLDDGVAVRDAWWILIHMARWLIVSLRLVDRMVRCARAGSGGLRP